MRTILAVTAAATLTLGGAGIAQTMSPPGAGTAGAAGQARSLIKEFTTRLQGKLKGALQQGGPAAAVRVC